MLLGVDAVIFPLVTKFISAGDLPNLKKMVAEGASGEAVPCLPPYTPTNWATLATGAWTGTHGAPNWVAGIPDNPRLSTFDSRTITADSIWQAAESAGLKSLCAAYPSSYPKRTRQGYVITPLHRGLVTLFIVPGQEYAVMPQTASGTKIVLLPASGWQGATEGALEAEIIVQGGETGGSIVARVGATEDGGSVQSGKTMADASQTRIEPVIYNLLVTRNPEGEYDRVLICREKNAGEPLAKIRVEEWSDWIIDEYIVTQQISSPTAVDINGKRKGSARFKLLKLSADGSDIRLVRSEVYPTTDFTDPAFLSEELITEIGPYCEHACAPLTENLIENDPLLLETVLEEIRYQALWQVKAAEYILNKYGWDLYYLHWHWPDTVVHKALSPIEPENPQYDPVRAKAYLELFRSSYQIMDEMIGGFLRLADHDTYTFVVSDHGCVPNYKLASVPKLLKQKGLMEFKDETHNPINVDMAKTKVYYKGMGQLAVNLTGREPGGVVDPQDYEKIRNEVIKVLQTWEDPLSGKLVTLFTMKVEDCALLGFWGDRTGDIIYVLNQEYYYNGGAEDFLSTGTEETIAAGSFISAHHGCVAPTAKTSMTSNLATYIINGPHIQKNYSRDHRQRGHIRLLDIVPTICHVMGMQPPHHCEGTVLWDHLVR